MVGRGTNQGGEGGVGVGAALSGVDKSTVKACHDRGGAFVAPGVEAIQEREFHDPKAVECIIEKGA